MKWPAAGLKPAKMCFTEGESGLQPSFPFGIVETECKQIAKGLEQVDRGIPLTDWHSAPWTGALCPSPCPWQLSALGGLLSDTHCWVCVLLLHYKLPYHCGFGGVVFNLDDLTVPGQMRFYLSHSQNRLLSVSTVQILSSCSSSGLAILLWVCRHMLTRWFLLGSCFVWMSQKNSKLTLRAAVFKQMF